MYAFELNIHGKWDVGGFLMKRVQTYSGKAVLVGSVLASSPHRPHLRVWHRMNETLNNICVYNVLFYNSSLQRVCLSMPTTQTLMRNRAMRRLIWVSTVCKCIVFGLICINVLTVFHKCVLCALCHRHR